jgi:hypothetical protein
MTDYVLIHGAYASLAITFPMLVVVATFCLLWRSLSV